jgi:hypothetical protein
MELHDEPQIEAVNWFLDFLNDDLDNISELAFNKRALEVRHYCLSYWFEKSMKDVLGKVHENKLALEDVRAIADYLYALPEDFPWKDTIKNIQTNLKEFVENIIEFPVAEKIGDVSLTFRSGFGKWFIDINPIKPIGRADDPQKMIEAAKISFCLASNGLHKGSIKKCKECDKYFLHLTKKPKYFCSSKCGSRYLSRKRREADPDGYRVKQREIMRKKYREKKAKELGKPIDKVKIQERVKKK